MLEEININYLTQTHASIDIGCVEPEIHNHMIELGFKYYVIGDITILNHTDPRSGMPDTSSTTHFFKIKDDAEAYASTQKDPFHMFDIKVCDLVHQETSAERDLKAQNAKAKKIAREQREAERLGMNPEEYDAFRKARNNLRRYRREIRKNQSMIENLTEENILLQSKIEKVLAKYGQYLQ